jgi:hypothetical protein
MLTRSAALTTLVLAFTPLAAGCIGEDDTIVFVDPNLEAPAAAVTGGALGTSLSGGFRLKLVLGPRASGPSRVTVGAFSIMDAAQKAALVPTLELTSSLELPVTVTPGSEVSVDFTFDTGAETLPSETKDALCASDGVRIVGSVQDSLQDGVTPVASAPFDPSGCM